MTEYDSGPNRRKYPRYNAPICYRSAPFFSSRNPLINIGLGGIRIYSDEKFKIGKRLQLELVLPNNDILKCTVKVVWQKELPEDTIAKYDVGLQFLSVPEEDLQRLEEVLNQHTDTIT